MCVHEYFYDYHKLMRTACNQCQPSIYSSIYVAIEQYRFDKLSNKEHKMIFNLIEI